MSVFPYVSTSIHQYVHASDHSAIQMLIQSYIRISVCSGIHLNELPLCRPSIHTETHSFICPLLGKYELTAIIMTGWRYSRKSVHLYFHIYVRMTFQP